MSSFIPLDHPFYMHSYLSFEGIYICVYCVYLYIYIYGYGSKPWYLVNPKIARKWMFIPLKMVLIGIDPSPYTMQITNHENPDPFQGRQFAESRSSSSMRFTPSLHSRDSN